MTMMVQTRPGGGRGFKIGGVVLAAALLLTAALVVPKSALSYLAKNNIFALVGDLNGTTSQMLQHTQQLRTRVREVQGQLGQLQQQDAIISQQQATGQHLQQLMTVQTQLTQQGVHLMQQILSHEATLSHATAQVATQSGQLTGVISDDANVLGHLLQSLVTSSQESNKLNSQLDSLLAQLNESVQEFRAFGQVDHLLSGLLGSQSESSLLPGVGGLLGTKNGAGLPGVGGLLGGSTSGSNSGNSVSNTGGNSTTRSPNSSSGSGSGTPSGSTGNLVGGLFNGLI